MKFTKALLLLVLSFLLTGCYTQLQYAQKMRKVTDRKPVQEYSEEEDEPKYADYYTEERYDVEEDDYIPIYYKDYQYAERYADCFCNPYARYEFSHYRPFPSWYYPYSYRWRYHHRIPPGLAWHLRYHYGYPYYGSHFSITFSWGSYYDPFYYDPFFYDFYWYRHHPFTYNYRSFYGNRRYIYHYGQKKWDYTDVNRRYRTRDSDRVWVRDRRTRAGSRTDRVERRYRTRSRSQSVGRSSNRTRTRVTRSRSTKSRVRSTGRTTRSRSRSDNGNNRSSRTRDRVDKDDNRSRDRDHTSAIRYRTLDRDKRMMQELKNSKEIRSRLRSATLRSKKQRSRSTFLKRLQKFFKQNTRTSTLRNNSRSRRIRSSNNNDRPSLNRNTSRRSSSRSSVGRSRSSSSSKSRSRGGSSRSRSRGSSGGDSDRSRGN